MLSHYSRYLENKLYDQYQNQNKLYKLDKTYIKYLKYKKKYQLLKEKLKNQLGGKKLGFYINVQYTKNYLVNKVEYKKIEIGDKSLNIESNGDVNYLDSKTGKKIKIYNGDVKAKYHIGSSYYYLNKADDTKKNYFTIQIYEESNDIILTLSINT